MIKSRHVFIPIRRYIVEHILLYQYVRAFINPENSLVIFLTGIISKIGNCKTLLLKQPLDSIHCIVLLFEQFTFTCHESLFFKKRKHYMPLTYHLSHSIENISASDTMYVLHAVFHKHKNSIVSVTHIEWHRKLTWASFLWQRQCIGLPYALFSTEKVSKMF